METAVKDRVFMGNILTGALEGPLKKTKVDNVNNGKQMTMRVIIASLPWPAPSSNIFCTLFIFTLFRQSKVKLLDFFIEGVA
jgi:hypothetical protein